MQGLQQRIFFFFAISSGIEDAHSIFPHSRGMTRVTIVVVVAEQVSRSQQDLITSECSVWMKKYITLTQVSIYEYIRSNLRCLS